jgi:hypothetical protein
MMTKLNLLLSLIGITGMNAQQQNSITNQNEAAKGEIVTKGRLIYTEIRINASAEKVWNVFTDFEKYPQWNPFVRSLNGVPKQKATIEVMIQPPGKKATLFKPCVLQFEKEKEFRWVGQFILPRLFDGEHVFLIKDNGDGSCTFIQQERFRGILVPMLRSTLENNTLQGFEQMNLALKNRCEQN